MGRKRILFLNLLLGTVIYLEKPVLPLYLEELNIPLQNATYLFAVLAFFIMLFAPMWGDIGDKRGRKVVLIISAIGMAVSQLIFGMSNSLTMLVISRIVQGIFLSSIVVSFMAYFNDNARPENRARLISLNIAFIGLGIALGSFIGGYLGQMLALRNIYYLQSIMFIISTLFIIWLYPKDTVHIDIRRQYVFGLVQNIKRVGSLGLLPGMMLTMTFSVGVYVILNYLEFYLLDIDYTVFEIGLYVFVIGIIGVIGNATITHVLLDRFNEFRLLTVTLLIGGVSLLLTALYPVIGLFSFMFVFALVHNKFKPITTQIIHKNAQEEQGMALGVRETLIHFGMLIGSIIGGLLIYNPVMIFYFASGIMFLCAIGFELLFRKNA